MDRHAQMGGRIQKGWTQHCNMQIDMKINSKKDRKKQRSDLLVLCWSATAKKAKKAKLVNSCLMENHYVLQRGKSRT